MATRWAVASGNWSSTSTWNGGTLPASGDDVYANTFTVTIDQNINVSTLRTTTGSGIGAGGGFKVASGATVALTITTALNGTTHMGATGFLITVDVAATVAITCPSFTGGANLRLLNPAHASAAVTFNGDLVGGSGASSASYNPVEHQAGALTVNGNLTRLTTAANSSPAVVFIGSSTKSLSVVGSITAPSTGTVSGLAGVIYVHSDVVTGAISVTGDITASTATPGVYCIALSSSLTLTLRGIQTAGSTQNAVQLSTTGPRVRVSGELVVSSTGLHPMSIPANIWVVVDGEELIYRMRTDATGWAAGPFPTSKALSAYGSNNPAPADVRQGVSYSTGGSATGTLAVPPAASVASGVPVDNTTGTAAVKLTDIASVVGAQIAAATSA